MTVLILSQRLDYHGRAVKWGLEQLGVEVHWWDRSLYPISQTLSVSFREAASLRIGDGKVSDRQGAYGAIWERRGKVPTASRSLPRADRIVAVNESKKLLDGVVSLIELRNPSALLVNPSREQTRVGEKLVQLHVAEVLGFRVPRTLMSNDPDDIRAFRKELKGGVVAKQNFPFSWRQSNGDLLLSGTFVVPDDAFADDEMLSSCPMIYQERLDISSEIRVTIFGRSIFAGRQPRAMELAPGYADIRMERRDTMAPVKLDADIERMLFEYLDRMNIAFAAFDLAECSNGELVFLECNECGQFLSYEEFNPDEPMLDTFCQFLAKADKNFKLEKLTGLSLKAYNESPDGIKFKAEFSSYFKDEYEKAPFELTDY